MQARMDKNGTITIQAENGLESFALKLWSEKNTTFLENHGTVITTGGLIIDPNPRDFKGMRL